MKPAPATRSSNRLSMHASRLAWAVALAMPVLMSSPLSLAGGNADERVSEIVIEPAELDWVPLRQVPRELRDRRCENCRGRYIDPLAVSEFIHGGQQVWFVGIKNVMSPQLPGNI